MKTMLSNLAMTLMITGLVVTASFAQGKNRSTTFKLSENLMVGETVLEKGEYQLKFDANSSELRIVRDGEVVKTVRARVVETDRKAANHSLETKQHDKGKMLVSVKFEGDRRTILLGDFGSGSVTGEGQN
jgi:hypothetical protein